MATLKSAQWRTELPGGTSAVNSSKMTPWGVNSSWASTLSFPTSPGATKIQSSFKPNFLWPPLPSDSMFLPSFLSLSLPASFPTFFSSFPFSVFFWLAILHKNYNSEFSLVCVKKIFTWFGNWFGWGISVPLNRNATISEWCSRPPMC